jgi:hypothetical protein
VADAQTSELGEDAFDTVVLGDVIGDLEEPARMLARAADLLKPEGRLVLTTPFGHSPHADHRQEFRTTELVDLLSARFVIDQLSVVDGCFCVSARAMTAPILQERRIPDPHRLLVITEEAAIAAQRHLRSQLAQKERALTEKIRRLGRQLEHQKRVTATVQARMRQAQSRLKQQQKGVRQELGRAVEKSLSSPLGVLRLPLRIAKAYRRARRRAEAAQLAAPASPRPETRPAGADAPGIARRQDGRPAAPPIPHHDLSSAFPPYAFPDCPPRCNLRVAAILDEFSDACFRYEADLVRLTKESWREQIERDRPEFLFVESAWRGNRENWRGLIKNARETTDNPLDALVGYCRAHDIPTAFWNKEDPPNFDLFIDAAAKFDYVFTTDADCIERYRGALGHQRIAALPFAAQPKIHNPIGKEESDDFEVAFAGTWYGQKHEERGALLPILLDAAAGRNLHIFDRMSGHTRNDFYEFPEKYAPYLRVGLPYARVLSAYRRFKVFLNVNSVTDSPTMLARRVFEILASSTAVVSTASTAIERMLGDDVVSLVHDEEEARAELDKLLSDPGYRQRRAHVGYRKVIKQHTYEARFRTVVRALDLELGAVPAAPKVSVILTLDDPSWLDNALANLRRQRYPQIEPLWVLKDGFAAGLTERLMRERPSGRIVEASADASRAAMLGRGIELATGDLIGAFEPRDFYGPEFIGDLVLALTYADVDIAGKVAHFSARAFAQSPVLNQPASCHRHVDQVIGTAWLARRAALEGRGIERMLRFKDGRPLIGRGQGTHRMYSADPYNYLRFEGGGGAPSTMAANLERCDSIGIAGAEIMI